MNYKYYSSNGKEAKGLIKFCDEMTLKREEVLKSIKELSFADNIIESNGVPSLLSFNDIPKDKKFLSSEKKTTNNEGKVIFTYIPRQTTKIGKKILSLMESEECKFNPYNYILEHTNMAFRIIDPKTRVESNSGAGYKEDVIFIRVPVSEFGQSPTPPEWLKEISQEEFEEIAGAK